MTIIRAILIASFILIVSAKVFPECGSEPTLDDLGNVLATKKFSLERPAEVLVTISALTSQTSWRSEGSEAAAVTLFVDGQYNQDVLLFSGEDNLVLRRPVGFAYRVFIGQLSKGTHKIDVSLNRGRSARAFGLVRVADLLIGFEELSPTERAARSNAPFIYARPNAVDKFTDIPLVMYYETFAELSDVTRIRYTVIFTNEDGGTRSKALMARWGRMTDIEWVYEVRLDRSGSVISETYQGANHQTLNFKGRRVFGSHPLLYTVTDNNNFSDTGCSALRFGLEPRHVDLSSASRETVMERFPWTYRIMANEMFREGRVAANSPDENIVEDPREYIYAEIYNEPQTTAVAFEVLTTDDRKLTSDLGNAGFRVDRPGYIRLALHVPADLEKSIKAYAIRCYPTGSSSNGTCKNLRLVKIVRLNENFEPTDWTLNWPAQTVNAGDAAVFGVRQ